MHSSKLHCPESAFSGVAFDLDCFDCSGASEALLGGLAADAFCDVLGTIAESGLNPVRVIVFAEPPEADFLSRCGTAPGVSEK